MTSGCREEKRCACRDESKVHTSDVSFRFELRSDWRRAAFLKEDWKQGSVALLCTFLCCFHILSGEGETGLTALCSPYALMPYWFMLTHLDKRLQAVQGLVQGLV
jgi:hypothetical protein